MTLIWFIQNQIDELSNKTIYFQIENINREYINYSIKIIIFSFTIFLLHK